MAKRPPPRDADGDLGPGSTPHSARPLTRPSAAALRRAAPLFAQLVGLGPASAEGGQPDPLGPAAAAPPGPVPQRRYPLAAKLLAAHLEQAAGAAFALAVDAVALEDAGQGDGAAAPNPAGPPAQLRGFVRKSVAASRAEAVPQVLLEDVAQMALVDAGSELAPSSFVIVFREELLGELQCRLEVGPTGQITATFVAADAHTRRLLTHEAPRLRAKLTGHGLHDVLLNISDS